MVLDCMMESNTQRFSVISRTPNSNEGKRTPLTPYQPISVIKEPSKTWTKSVNRRKNLPKHIVILEGKPITYKCTVCSTSFKSKSNCCYHKHCGDDAEKPFTCSICGRKFSTKTHFSYHILMHTGVNPFNCSECSKSFKTKYKLRRHQQTHTDTQKKFSCDICGRTFLRKSSIRVHKRMHTGIKPYQCNECPKAFREKKNLIFHLSHHTGVKNWICEICGKSYSLKWDLELHKRAHTRVRPYRCTVNKCQQAFSQKRYLKRHMETHKNFIKFACSICEKEFSRKDNIQRHIVNTHLESQNLNVLKTQKTKFLQLNTAPYIQIIKIHDIDENGIEKSCDKQEVAVVRTESVIMSATKTENIVNFCNKQENNCNRVSVIQAVSAIISCGSENEENSQELRSRELEEYDLHYHPLQNESNDHSPDVFYLDCESTRQESISCNRDYNSEFQSENQESVICYNRNAGHSCGKQNSHYSDDNLEQENPKLMNNRLFNHVDDLQKTAYSCSNNCKMDEYSRIGDQIPITHQLCVDYDRNVEKICFNSSNNELDFYKGNANQYHNKNSRHGNNSIDDELSKSANLELLGPHSDHIDGIQLNERDRSFQIPSIENLSRDKLFKSKNNVMLSEQVKTHGVELKNQDKYDFPVCEIFKKNDEYVYNSDPLESYRSANHHYIHQCHSSEKNDANILEVESQDRELISHCHSEFSKDISFESSKLNNQRAVMCQVSNNEQIKNDNKADFNDRNSDKFSEPKKQNLVGIYNVEEHQTFKNSDKIISPKDSLEYPIRNNYRSFEHDLSIQDNNYNNGQCSVLKIKKPFVHQNSGKNSDLSIVNGAAEPESRNSILNLNANDYQPTEINQNTTLLKTQNNQQEVTNNTQQVLSSSSLIYHNLTNCSTSGTDMSLQCTVSKYVYPNIKSNPLGFISSNNQEVSNVTGEESNFVSEGISHENMKTRCMLPKKVIAATYRDYSTYDNENTQADMLETTINIDRRSQDSYKLLDLSIKGQYSYLE